MSFIIFDTEYIADKGLYEKGFDGWKNIEIIQIAALKVSEELQVENKLNFYTLPIKHPAIPPYFISVTGITNEIMQNKGIPFMEAYKQFAEFAQNITCYSHGWGSPVTDKCDGNVMEQTLSYYPPLQTPTLKYLNIAPWFQFQYEKNNLNIKSQASGNIAALLGLEENLNALGLKPHNAFYDVYSILEGLRHFGFKQSDIKRLY